MRRPDDVVDEMDRIEPSENKGGVVGIDENSEGNGGGGIKGRRVGVTPRRVAELFTRLG